MKILVLDVPALHLGYLGCYGNDWVGTPNIDRLASESVVFDRHYYDVEQPSPDAWTGHHPLPMPTALPFPKVATLADLLREQGQPFEFLTTPAAVSEDSLENTVDQTIAALHEMRPITWARFPALAPPWDLPDDLLNSYCEEDDEPWPDPPHGALEDADDLPRLQSTYAAVVTYLDANLGVLLDELRARGQLDEILVCLTAGSGLPLAEHGALGLPYSWAYEELVHLPLLLRLPRAENAGVRLDALTQPVDLFPTFLEHLGIAPPPSHGHSLWPLLRHEVERIRPFACSGVRSGAGIEWALRTREWALLLPVAGSKEILGQAQLFVKPDDRWEVNDVRQHHLDLVEELEQTLRDYAVATQKPGPISLG